jgi:hypothetical protein
MATTDLEKLVVQMSLDIRKFEQSLAKANGTTVRELTKIENKFKTSQRNITTAASSFTRGLVLGAVTAGVAGLSAAIKGAVSQAAALGDLADKLGETTDHLQELQFGAVQANLSFDELSTSLLRFSKNTAEANSGQGELFKILKANGVELKGTFNENLKTFADLVRNAKNEQEALLLITAAFGRGSDEMLEFLRNGSAGLEKFAADATNAGAKIDEAFIRTAQDIDDRWAALMLTMGTRTKNFVLSAVDLFRQLQQEGFNLGGVQLLVPSRPPPPRPDLETIRGGPGAGAPRRTTIIPTREEEEAQRKLERERERSLRTLEREREQFSQTLITQGQRTDAIRLETELLGEGTQAQETARAKLELYNAAMDANIVLTADVRKEIEAAAEAYGAAAVSFELAQERMQFITDANEELKDSLQGFFRDIADGVKPIDALNDALGRLADRLLDLALDRVLSSLLGTGAGAPAGGFLGSLFHSGGIVGQGGAKRRISPLAFIGAPRMHSGGIAGNEVPAILKRGEVVLPSMPTRRGGGGVEVNIINRSTGTEVQQSERRGPDGRQIIEAIVMDTMGKKLPKLMATQFGIPTRLQQRGS